MPQWYITSLNCKFLCLGNLLPINQVTWSVIWVNLFLVYVQWSQACIFLNYFYTSWFICTTNVANKNVPSYILIISSYRNYILQEIFLGKPLRDYAPSIIHHFAFYDNPTKFLYPDPAAGFALTLRLVKRFVFWVCFAGTALENFLSMLSIFTTSDFTRVLLTRWKGGL